MIDFGHYQVHLLPLLSLILVWVVAFQVLALMFAQMSRNSLVAWSLSIFGIMAIYLRKPHAVVRLAQLMFPLVGAGMAVFWLTRIQMALISGLPNTKDVNLWIATVETLILGTPRLWGAVAELRYPLWGEARFIDRVARGPHNIAFTTMGRTYIRERFDTSPEEFVRIVRRRPGTVATGNPIS